MSDDFKLTIREMVREDQEIILDFYNAMGEESRTFFNLEKINETRTLRFLNGELPYHYFWIATTVEKGQEICLGLVFLWDLHTKLPWLGVAVRDGYHGHRIGSRLMECAKSYCADINCGGILLTTAYSNEKGQRLYENQGFEKTGVAFDEYLYIFRYPNPNIKE